MQITKQKVSPKVQKDILEMFAQLIADISQKEDALVFINDFLTETERIALAKRLAIIFYLDKKMSYQQIRKQIGVSSATIASVQSCLDQKSAGFLLALQYLKAEEWAGKWSQKLTSIFGKKDK